MSERKNSLAVQRIDALLDENSFVELGSGITSRNTDFNRDQANTPSDGVVTGHGLIDGNLVFVYSQNPEVCGGSIGEMHAKHRLSASLIPQEFVSRSPMMLLKQSVLSIRKL